MSGAKRAVHDEWYTPYFAPTTVLIAVTVLIVSVEAGRYAGNYFIERDKAAQAAQASTVVPLSQSPTKAATHGTQSRSHPASSGKTQH
jgi:hypothetical protein